MHDFWEVGRILKVHGVKGALVIQWDPKATKVMQTYDFVYMEIDGDPVPFFYNHRENWGEDTELVTFEDIQSREEAKSLTGQSTYIKKDLITDEETITLSHSDVNAQHLLAGYTIIDIHSQESYAMQSVEIYPHQKMASVRVGANIRMIPLVEAYIVSQDDERKEIKMNLPEGLI